MTARELTNILEQAGFKATEGARHTKWKHPDGRVTVIHRHKGDIPRGTLKAIFREAGLPMPQGGVHAHTGNHS